VSASEVTTAWRQALLAELVWVGHDGRPDAMPVIPLLANGAPAVALTWDQVATARAIGSSPTCVIGVTTPAVADGTTPVTARARVVLDEDATGERFALELLDQELRKHPPSRRRADSMLLRSEHWWFLPRLLVRAVEVGETRHHAVGDALAAVSTPDGVEVTTAEVVDDEVASRLPDGPAVVLQHGARVPELDPRWLRRWHGAVRGGRFAADRLDVEGAPGRPAGLWRRWRDEVALERSCRAALRDAGA
jgi:hypothetical protein